MTGRFEEAMGDCQLVFGDCKSIARAVKLQACVMLRGSARWGNIYSSGQDEMPQPKLIVQLKFRL